MSSNNSIFDVMEFNHQKSDIKSKEETLTRKQTLISFETQHSFLQISQESNSSDSDDESIIPKTKEIKKISRKRQLKENSKWSSNDQMKYWKFYVVYQTLKPYQKISWTKWKGDSIYKYMAKFVGKTAKQCKSKDQNMKTKFSLSGDNDIVTIAIRKLKQLENEYECIKGCLNDYYSMTSKKSQHMILLQKRMEMLTLDEERLNMLFRL